MIYRDTNELMIIPGARKEEEQPAKVTAPSFKQVRSNIIKYSVIHSLFVARKIHVQEKAKEA